MPMAPRAPLMLDGPYRPAIHSGQRNDRPRGLLLRGLEREDSADGGCADEWHLHTFGKNDVIGMLRKIDVEVVRVRAVPAFFMPIRYVILARRS